jgi:hypothetical protein
MADKVLKVKAFLMMILLRRRFNKIKHSIRNIQRRYRGYKVRKDRKFISNQKRDEEYVMKLNEFILKKVEP